jgi:uncharacterized protein
MSSMKQYIYQLKLIPNLLEESNWSDRENSIVGEHFQQLKMLRDEGTVKLAGRTLTMDEDGFGIVIIEAESDSDARNLMENDPAVKKGIMTATLFPFHIAL